MKRFVAVSLLLALVAAAGFAQGAANYPNSRSS